MLLPGSFSGKLSSPKPLLGPDPKNLISLAIFIKETAKVFKAPDKKTRASLEARASNLLGAETKSNPVFFSMFSATFSENPT